MKLQQLLSYTRRAIDDYNMINDGDRIAVGISGGKDSLALLYAFHGLKRFYPNHFDIEALTVDLGFGIQDFSAVESVCQSLNINYTVIKTDIAKVVFELKREESPCSLCAKMRKGALNETAKKLNCNKVAYAHHKDDIVETMLLSLIYEGRFHSFSPVTYLNRSNITVIRPMIYVDEYCVTAFAKKYNLPVAKNPCPVDGHTKREYAKNLIKKLSSENPGCKDRMFHAITNGNIKGWPEI